MSLPGIWKLVAAAVALLAVCAIVTSCGGPGRARHAASEAPAAASIAVTTAPAALHDAQQFQEFTGTVQARTEVQVAAKITAHILQIPVHDGMRVRKGDVLVRLDDAELQTRVKQAEAGVGAAEAAERQAKANLDAAQAAKVEADQDLNRYQETFKAGASTQQQVQQAEAKAKGAQANVERAAEGIAEAQKQVARAKALVQEAQASLDYAVVHSPMDGVVLRKQAEPGDLAAPGRTLMTLQSPADLRLEAPVSESCARNIKLGDPARVVVDAAGADLPVRVNEIVPAVDPKSRAFLVRADLPSMPGLQPGLFGRLVFPCGPRKVLAVPQEALISRGQLDLAFVVQDGRARLRLVTVGRTQQNWTEVLSGLSAGESVVLAPPRELVDGAAVTMKAEAAK
jgi:RND family efflux transporter MFP subunit